VRFANATPARVAWPTRGDGSRGCEGYAAVDRDSRRARGARHDAWNVYWTVGERGRYVVRVSAASSGQTTDGAEPVLPGPHWVGSDRGALGAVYTGHTRSG